MFSTRCHLLRRSLLAVNNANTNKVSGGERVAVESISTSAVLHNYYEALGIPQGATQTDIKTAYYKLSMQFHPDKNKGEQAAAKFREISQAYEVLGNYRLRRLYDKGIIHTADAKYAQPHRHAEDVNIEVEDDDETKFYKSRFRKTKVGDAAGRTPIYDFDEWSRAHYGNTLNRRQAAKMKFDKKQAADRNRIFSLQNELTVFGFIFCVVVMYAIYHAESSYDTPKSVKATETNGKS